MSSQDTLNKLNENFNTRWSAYTRFVSAHPKTGQAIAATVGLVVGAFLRGWIP